MAETSIEWTATVLPDGTRLPGYSFNPWIGCTEVSPACDHCYARDFIIKKPRWATAWSGERFRTSVDYWKQPLKWNREAERSGIRRKVFCASLADVFDNQVDPRWRADLWGLIDETQNLDWLLLTKRPQNARKMIIEARRGLLRAAVDDRHVDWPWPNVWLGTTVENQEEADRRIWPLLQVPAKVHFLSCEPLLGPLDLTNVDPPDDGYGGKAHGSDFLSPHNRSLRPQVDWVIAGGESGPNARPSHPDWFRSLRDQCAAANVPFFFKQWGNWTPCGDWYANHPRSLPIRVFHNGEWTDEGDVSGEWMANIGKKLAGATLDGRQHREMPDG